MAGAVLLTAWLATTTPAVLGVALPILLLWLASPALAWWVSRPLPRRKATLSDDQLTFLRTLARRVWDFFETYVGPEDNWLPPDNFQQYRIATVAHRTSPTNMGLALLANLTAYDFGFIPSGVLLERTQNTLETMTSLPRYQQHFYNWYDTRALHPLLPMYVSTVDSGNLAGHLLTLRAGLLALPDEQTSVACLLEGLSATLAIFDDERRDKSGDHPAIDDQARAFWQLLETARAAPPASLRDAHASLLQLAAAADEMATQTDIQINAQINAQSTAQARSLPVATDATDASERTPARVRPAAEAVRWAHALARQSRAAVDDLAALAPWLTFANLPDPFAEEGAEALGQTAGLPTLRGLAAAG
ncbi:MAG: cyclic beta 1-2 glucan synthetase, partial [Propionivibrio sp.]